MKPFSIKIDLNNKVLNNIVNFYNF